MTHIANCMRPAVDKSTYMCNMDEEPASDWRSARSDTKTKTRKPLGEELEVQSQPASTALPKYQLFPSPRTPSPTISWSQVPNPERATALSIGRSPTSLSDTIVTNNQSTRMERTTSLSQRRKVSVPELKARMATVQELFLDSPTIPGRPPLRRVASETMHPERSSSAPGCSWRQCAFGDAMISCVTGPSNQLPGRPVISTQWPSVKSETLTPLLIHRPLSPILSPSRGSTPSLKLDTASHALEGPKDRPPTVPPKPPGKCSLASKSSSRTVRGNATTPTSNPVSAVSPVSSSEIWPAPDTGVKQTSPRNHHRKASGSSIIDRGRPVGKSFRCQTNDAKSVDQSPSHHTEKWKVPSGLRPAEASKKLPEAEKESLRKQAKGQADKFEILNAGDVASLSRELRAIEERCEYLRKNYKSLRAGRQKMHNRMITYLRNETITLSRLTMLKQEETLAELDKSIDDWMLKLELAENRRLQLRQKLLEHIAGAMTLSASATTPPEFAGSTPPGSPVDAGSPSRVKRRDVESIKIYADGHILNLFSDIEYAMEKMCEAC